MSEPSQKRTSPTDGMTQNEEDAYVDAVVDKREWEKWFAREIQPALDSIERGEATLWEGSEAFIAKMKARHGIE